jgi:copper(I)-binding protein
MLTLALTGCGSRSTTSAGATAPAFASTSTHDIKLSDGWVSAAGDMGDMPGMTMSPGSMAGGSMAEGSMAGGSMSGGSMSGGSMSGGSMSGTDMSGNEATAYATLTDTGTSPDALVSVSTPDATKVTLHNTVTSANGSAGTMVGVSDIAVPAGGQVTLAPGGYHVMLEGLKGDLKVGTRITMTWTFRSGTSLTTSFPVIDPADRPQDEQ